MKILVDPSKLEMFCNSSSYDFKKKEWHYEMLKAYVSWEHLILFQHFEFFRVFTFCSDVFPWHLRDIKDLCRPFMNVSIKTDCPLLPPAQLLVTDICLLPLVCYCYHIFLSLVLRLNELWRTWGDDIGEGTRVKLRKEEWLQCFETTAFARKFHQMQAAPWTSFGLFSWSFKVFGGLWTSWSYT